ncbi:TatD family hydrolase [Paenibacillus bovis]|uniref:TatD family hydrolase n=1 Tax=Paenibacillus bovis TaxID=1616788 RepID=UPI0009EA0530|nr:TatD family hydrolase [Paenibacillus bovis]
MMSEYDVLHSSTSSVSAASLSKLQEKSPSIPSIDSHIHLDQYDDDAIRQMMQSLPNHQVESIIAVSMNKDSCQRIELLSRQYPGLVYPAYGYHPEQPLPSRQQTSELLEWIESRMNQLVAVGEIGLPYYLRQELAAREEKLDEAGYIQLLEQYLQLAAKHDKPVVLHAVYEDADTVCQLLEEYRIRRAHFHWFKGSAATVKRMAQHGYHISFTPDIAYEPEIRELAALYPRELVMAETDGPWPFEGPFTGQSTHPRMTADVCREWAAIQGLSEYEARQILYANTCNFYQLNG